MTKLRSGDVVMWVDHEIEGEPLQQKVRLQRLATGDNRPSFADQADTFWIVKAVSDGPRLKQGELDFARKEELIRVK